MNNLTFIHDYKENTDYRNSFNQLAQNTFGINFEQWYQKGYWNERYVCYSFADGNQVIANVSINFMDIMLEGERKKALQIGTVMTHPDYCNRGLSASLMNKIIDEYEHKCDFFYLFANKSVLNLYPKFGFIPQGESQYSITVTMSNTTANTIQKLDPSNKNDLNLIMKLVSRRKPISTILGVENAQNLFMFYCLYVFPHDIYYLKEKDVLLIFKQEKETLHMYDVVSEKEVYFNDVLNHIASVEIKRVVFYFTPNFTDIDPSVSEYVPDDILFVKSNTVKLTDKLKFPITAQA